MIGYGLIVGCLMGSLSSFITEQFATTSRYTGASLGYQLAATLGGGFAPLISANILAASGGRMLLSLHSLRRSLRRGSRGGPTHP